MPKTFTKSDLWSDEMLDLLSRISTWLPHEELSFEDMSPQELRKLADLFYQVADQLDG